MTTSANFSKPALACLIILMLIAPTLWAQSPKGAVGPPAPPPPVSQEPPPSLPIKSVADALAPTGWGRYGVGEPERFSLILPGQPNVDAQRMNLSPEVTITVRTYMTMAESGVYGATYLEGFPIASMNEANKRTFFQTFVTSFMDSFQESVKDRGVLTSLNKLEQRVATASGLEGYEQDFSYDRMMGRVRLVFDGGRAYAVMAFWNAFSLNSERSIFFESLRVNTKR